jgi:hypothetical protein
MQGLTIFVPVGIGVGILAFVLISLDVFRMKQLPHDHKKLVPVFVLTAVMIAFAVWGYAEEVSSFGELLGRLRP